MEIIDRQLIESVKENVVLALDARAVLIHPDSGEALRLFNGFYEGYPNLVIDLYDKTLVLYDYHASPEAAGELLDTIQGLLLSHFEWVTCVIVKKRNGVYPHHRTGVVTFGDHAAQSIQENGIHYVIDLTLNQDASFYLDTRFLRRWLMENSAGRRVLNTFAYTGSLGVAALAGGCDYLIQVDRNRRFLNLARQSGMLNRLDIGRMKLIAADFFSQIAALKQRRELFDCVIVDPPFFSSTRKGTINLAQESLRVINKVRPLVKAGGHLVSINNALFLSGADYIQSLEELCKDGYLSIESIIPAPPDMTGLPQTIRSTPPYPPAPFNHPTKIVVLRVSRKDKSAGGRD